MAAAEARGAWQRVANRCFVQEDAKRAPKLACCPSSSMKVQPDTSNGPAANGTYQPPSNFVLLNWNPMDSNLPPDTKWWLQLQPNFGYQNDVTCEQLSASEGLEVGGETVNPTSVFEDSIPIATTCIASEKKYNALEAPWMVSMKILKHETEANVEDLKAVNNDFQQKNKLKADFGGYWYQDEELMDWRSFDPLIPQKREKACSGLETHCMGSEKNEPWWCIFDKDELALLVAQKSLENFENCDLPRPQRVHFCGDPFCSLESFDDNRFLSSSQDHKLHAGVCCPVDYASNSSTFANMDGRCQTTGVTHSVHDLREAYGGTHKSTMHKCGCNPPESKHHSECDPDRAELVEALCHSQKRAREAEMAAKQAFLEKEHIVKLFFKQASHLFAYKQWVRMLQLESLFLQFKIKEQQISSLLPVFPWVPPRASHFGAGEHREKKSKGQRHQKCDICRYAVVFIVGLGLVSAGLLFGWTLGWL